SDTVPRHVLEAGQDDAAREHDPVASATVFAHKITAPALPWGAISAVVLVLVGLAAIAFLVPMRRGRCCPRRSPVHPPRQGRVISADHGRLRGRERATRGVSCG